MPIILVRGYFSNRGYFRYLARWFDAQGAVEARRNVVLSGMRHLKTIDDPATFAVLRERLGR